MKKTRGRALYFADEKKIQINGSQVFILYRPLKKIGKTRHITHHYSSRKPPSTLLISIQSTVEKDAKVKLLKGRSNIDCRANGSRIKLILAFIEKGVKKVNSIGSIR